MVMSTTKSKRKTTPPTQLETALKQAVIDSGLTLYAIAKSAGIDRASLLRFMSGERTLRLPHAGRVAGFLGFELRSVAKRS
jgi:hypothetical protein